jgi:hypothetical protein
MPIVIAALIGALADAAASLVGRVLIAMFISYVTYSGLDTLLSAIGGNIKEYMTGLPSVMVGLLGILKADVDVNIILSALTARATLNGLQNGSITRRIIKKS